MKQGNIIGKRIRLVRELRNWTQRQLARKLRAAGHDVSRDIVARWELCETPVTDLRILGLATVLRVSIQDLFPPRGRGRPRIF
ncbi:MAG TPA: helix-turn-helix transcriptional regulator [Candidatus Paceibacterota bacterium]|nr:helix-turn-helix transcriptional regulator [Candidatus Paceibacterota bacterium]